MKDSYYNKILEDALGIESLRFDDSDMERDEYKGTHIKRGGTYRKESVNTYTFPKHIACTFTQNGQRKGIKFPTNDFVVAKDYEYSHDNVVDVGDGMIQMSYSFFGKKKPLLLPYTFIGTKYELDKNRIANYLKDKITPNAHTNQ